MKHALPFLKSQFKVSVENSQELTFEAFKMREIFAYQEVYEDLLWMQGG